VISNAITLLAARLGVAPTIIAPTVPGSPSYRWLLNGYTIDGATSAVYTVPSVGCADSGKVYRSVLTNSAGSALGDSIVLRPIGCQSSLVAGVGDRELPLSEIDPAWRLARPWAMAPHPRWGMLVSDGLSLKTISASNGSVGKLFSADLVNGGGGSYGVATDVSGNIFALDGRAILMITPTYGMSYLAGANWADAAQIDGPGDIARFESPRGIATDRSGNVFVTDETTIRKVSPDGTVSTVAGLYRAAGSVDGRGADARFKALRGIALDATGMIYVVEEAGTVRRVSLDGVATTLAGVAGQRGLADGQGAAARFNAPQGIAIDASGNLLVADGANNRVRRVTSAGAVSTLPFVVAAPKSDDWVVTQETPLFIAGIAVDAAQAIWISAPLDGVLVKVTDGKSVQLVAGTFEPANLGIVDGLAGKARFGNRISGMAVTPDGTIYVSDSQTVRTVDRDGFVRTIAGAYRSTDPARDGKGSEARFFNLWALVVDPSGQVFALDDNAVRRVAPDGTVTTTRSLPFGDMTTAAMDAEGTLYFVRFHCELWAQSPDGVSQRVWGYASYCRDAEDIIGPELEPSRIRQVVPLPDGTLHIFSITRLTRLTRNGIELATFDKVPAASRAAVDSKGNTYFASYSGMLKISLAGATTVALTWPTSPLRGLPVRVCYGTNAPYWSLFGLTFDRDDNLYGMCDGGLYRIDVTAP